jgi:hypothetical protein
MTRSKKRAFRNGLLISMMAFYFSCGQEVFPPDSPENFPGYAQQAAPSAVFAFPLPFDLYPFPFEL